MSNFIPMVSSSPPPLDDGAGFDDWGDDDDDDFGNFMGADSKVSQTSAEKNNDGRRNDINNGGFSQDIPQFANFGKLSGNDEKFNKTPQTDESNSAFNDRSVALENGVDHVTIPNSDSGTGLNTLSPESECEKPTCLDIDGNSNQVMNQSTTVDSGLSISDTSPDHKSKASSEDETSEDKSDDIQLDGEDDGGDDFEDFQSSSCISDFKPEDAETSQKQASNSSSISDVTTNKNEEKSAIAADFTANSNSSHNENLENNSQQIQEQIVGSGDKMSGPSSERECEQVSEVSQQSEVYSEEKPPVLSEDISIDDSNVNCDNSMYQQNLTEDKTDEVIENEVFASNDANSVEKKCDPEENENEDERTCTQSENVSECNEREERQNILSPEKGREELESDKSQNPSISTVGADEAVCDDKGGKVHQSHIPQSFEKTHRSDSDDEPEDFAEFSSAPHGTDISEATQVKATDSEAVSQSDDDDKVTNRTDDVEDDFDDFNEFESVPKTSELDEEELNTCNDEQTEATGEEDSKSTAKESSAANSTNESDDDFDDFSSAPLSGNKDKETSTENFEAFSSSDKFEAFGEETAAGESGGDNWAAFGNQVTDDQLVADDDDFDDFADFQDVPVTKETSTEKPQDVAGNVFTVTFPVSMVTGSESGVMLMNDDLVADSSQTETLWTRLKKMDRASSVLKWTKAKSNKNLFTCLRIDIQNVLIAHKKQSVPIYAANLTLGGVLEPTKGPAKNSQQTESTLIDTTKEEKPYVPESRKTRSIVGSKTSSDIAPVQFDWSSAGLTNPLESGNKTLDLDFLVMGESEQVVKYEGSELMHGRKKPTLQPLENILANLKATTMKQGRQTEQLCEETKCILQSLPDLSFMHSKVLMFPLRQQNDP